MPAPVVSLSLSHGLLVLQRFLRYFFFDIMLPGLPKQVEGDANLLISLFLGKNIAY